MSSDPRDYKLDIGSLEKSARPADPPRLQARPWLSVLFRCCQVYQRVYRHRDGTRYEGRCPRCGAMVRFKVGHGGTGSRQFIAE